MIVTPYNFSKIYEAFALIDMDNGGTPLTIYDVPKKYKGMQLEAIEVGLGKLTGEQLSTFCTGECGDQDTLVTQFNLSLEHSFLNAFFDGWSDE